MGTKRNVDMSASQDSVKVVKSKKLDDQAEIAGENLTEVVVNKEETNATSDTKKKPSRKRSHTYTAVRAQVDKTKLYDAFAAIELIKKLSYSSFPGTITADVLVKEIGVSATLSFPHSTGKTVRVAIANDELIGKIEQGIIDFDVLIAEPRFVPKLAKYAKVLGPKGLMPNPKNGTITPNPEIKKNELEGGKITIKTEKKQAVMHVVIGKTDMETKALVENLQTLITALDFNLLKISISATMSPGVKVKVG